METNGYAGGQPWTVAWCRAKRILDNKQKTERKRRKLFFPLTKKLYFRKAASGPVESAQACCNTNNTHALAHHSSHWAALAAPALDCLLTVSPPSLRSILPCCCWSILHPVEEWTPSDASIHPLLLFLFQFFYTSFLQLCVCVCVCRLVLLLFLLLADFGLFLGGHIFMC